MPTLFQRHNRFLSLTKVPTDPSVLWFQDLKTGIDGRPCSGYFGTRAERLNARCASILAAKRLVFRYGIFAHALKDGNSGQAEFSRRGGGNDFMVTLGSPTTRTSVSIEGTALPIRLPADGATPRQAHSCTRSAIRSGLSTRRIAHCE